MYGRNAFGNPDGSRTDIEDMMQEFVIFERKYFSSGVASPDDLKTRVIVGPKGAGKTVYLRRMRANLLLNPSIFANSIEHEVPPSDLVIKFSQSFNSELITEKWSLAWKYAILRSVISNILFNSTWNTNVSNEQKDILKSYYNKLYPKFRRPMNVYSELKDIIFEHGSRNRFYNYSNLHQWAEVEAVVAEIMKELPPIYYFIDSVDDEYAHAPMYWMRCQKGLFYRVMRFTREETYGNKLHVIISIRDNVFSSVCLSEHHTRYINEEHIRILNWDYTTIAYFFKNKISKLDEEYFINEGERSLYNWLNRKTINNRARNITEPLELYILRHTRLLPRDVVVLGNSLAEIKQKYSSNPSLDIDALVRTKVSECSTDFGNELLTICANQINNNEMPHDAGIKDYSGVYTSIKEYEHSTMSNLKKLIIELGKDRFTSEDITRVNKKADEVLGENHSFFDVLWQNGAVGYLEEDPNGKREIFFNTVNPEFLLPDNKKTYLLRSCIIDSVGMELIKYDTVPVIGGYKTWEDISDGLL